MSYNIVSDRDTGRGFPSLHMNFTGILQLVSIRKFTTSPVHSCLLANVVTGNNTKGLELEVMNVRRARGD